MGTLGAPELIVILALSFGLPFVVLWRVADARGQSRAHALWGLLGWLGVVVGLLVMIATPKTERRQDRAGQAAAHHDATKGAGEDGSARRHTSWQCALDRRLAQFFRLAPGVVMVLLGVVLLVALVGGLTQK